MTDEEKAEEYVNSKGFGSDYNNIDSDEANEGIRQAYLDGLAEGRKEIEKELEWVTDTDNFVGAKIERCFTLEKENAELKAHCKAVDDVNEKMKCCGNCKHYYCSNDTKGKCKLLNPRENKCGFNICEKWELAE